MAKEAREIIAFSENQIGQRAKLKELKLGALHMARVAVDYAEKIGALPASLPQFSRATLIQEQEESPASQPPLLATVETPVFNIASYEQIISRLRITPEQFAQRSRYMEIGGRNASELEKFIEGKSEVGDYVRSMVRNQDEFTTLPQPDGRWFITLSNTELGIDNWVTTAQLLGTKEDVDKQGNPAHFSKGIGQGLGLELCLPEAGIYQRAADQGQPLSDVYWMAMKPITDSGGNPNVFRLERGEGGLWLNGRWAFPGHRWDPQSRLVWALPQVPSKP